ncbi:NADH-quinone oxidoreductase subunit G [Pseudonocardia sp. KRD-184]|uniref:NADH-quinone oxidoreductase n=1 Tax=Pseudonocardia oceani TaxID=2792013 RepID=A0ABS6U7A1_9PSEU|nr:NADH-quinone oxidoreductase subunit G [Pseudonocardia oceani]MBW0093558.1 NADH-quinone oxidoreductase subunit G [Pseudonocardia oceani]MBW0100098.1 NADH-quinone oxidoreductase subunit G [Pseudonocardia oceani]MBW0108950.1 NADH-quinone oxidoreductase subunit G [Pseudonocardia oceani]MBW0120882.1 NADH-quinone oxidoreductase subunit G [Pseudonocardia oceani]MBW0128093.1 NADH-quinone oxidoreductase subunit G [Pseudonocardia oceani]
MTIAPEKDTAPVPDGYVRLTIDGHVVDAPQGELLIRTCERLGIIVPRFCDHPLLDPAGACRQCLVEVEMGGRPMPKPQASCTMTVADGMVVKTQHTSPVAEKAQAGVMELLLINHPLDCPICDKGGECPLQNQAMTSGRTESRFVETKRTFPKPLPISTQVLLDRERCVLCQRCTRFSEEIAGDPFIDLLERGANQQVGVAEDKPFQSYFSGNTIQICPVGALTSAAYRFRSRPFDLVSTMGVDEHSSSGAALRIDTRRGTVLRRLSGNDPEVNEEWIDDKSRFAFRYLSSAGRITRPMVRGADGVLAETSWTEALAVAARGLAEAKAGGIGVLAGGRLTVEDAYAYGKFARVAAGTNDVDFRARPHSAEELEFLAAHVVGQGPEVLSYTRLEAAPAVLCVALEPEEEAPVVFLRLRKAARKHGQQVFHLGQWTTPAVERTSRETGAASPAAKDNLIPAVPGAEAAVLGELPDAVIEALRGGGVILVGERAAEVPGLYSAVSALAARTGAVVGWVPRRAGERGALEAGAVPTLLPGGRPVGDATARAEVEAAWALPSGSLPSLPGRGTAEILAAAADGELAALVVGGLDPYDLADPAAAITGLREVGFLVSLEMHVSAVTELADVVLPVAPDAHRAGSYVNWEGRVRGFDPALDASGVLPDCRVLDTLAVEMDADLFTQTPAAAAGEMARLGARTGAAPAAPATAPGEPRRPTAPGQAVLATWRALIDGSSLAVDEPALAGTARPALVRVNAATADRLGLTEGAPATVRTTRGMITLPVALTDLPDGVVWLPGNSGDSRVRALLGAGHGDLVEVTA